MDEQLERRIAFLRAANIEGMKHSDRGLLDHLLGTFRLLEKWAARPALCDAGLFHSVYGTDAYQDATIPFSMLNPVTELIGPEAENIVWHFCVMRRETLKENVDRPLDDRRVQNRFTQEWLPLESELFSDLANLVIANALEVVFLVPPRKWRSARPYVRADLLPLGPVSLPAAQAAIDVLLNPERTNGERRWWEFWK